MPNTKPKLQQSLQKLEELVRELEQKDVDVETGLEKFREGVQLVKFCQGQLKEAENEFKILKADLENDKEKESDD